MRADRLLLILLLLQNHQKMTTRELARKLEVSERTVIRDMEALSAAGIPVFAERGATGGWALTEGYRTSLTGMKREEIVSLLLVKPTDTLRDLGLSDNFETAYQKLLAASPSALRQDAELVRRRIHVDGAGWHKSNESFPHLSVVQEAVWEGRKLCITYQRGDEQVERVIHPLGLVAKRSTWYVVAETEGELRTYRISRIVEAHMLDEGFEPPVGFELAAYWEESTQQFKANLPRYPARVNIKDSIIERISSERFVKVLQMGTMKNGWVDAELEFNTLESACQIILGYGSHIEVLEPIELRDEVISNVNAIVELYQLQET
ncbi:helix-turn-helix transcriptional regulator [Brevibacillus sp. SYSU BS000544]|uniref:helix-turn-helix transcriptional regulator n=1 Tax=Brevibacillus sp. SYSU BS000544 TaxID=3416443 RepID=UPI003CE5B544